MRNIVVLLLMGFALSSCSVIVERPEIKGTVYDFSTKNPINGVSVYIDEEKIISDELGQFTIESVKRKKIFNFEGGHTPLFYSIELKHPKYHSATIKKGTRGSFGQKTMVYDSIFLDAK
ncbi:MAG: hypothetical protein CSA40_00645 [Flavobacteriales bacterium]|nr:MAG: hypothetical protein CSA40_00645 [Flavobacteriales bacterium]